MRLLAYVSPHEDDLATRAALKACGWASVAMRAGHLWRGEIERGFDSIWAGSFPGIVAAYVAAGVPACSDLAGAAVVRNPPPVELTSMPLAPVYVVLNPGKFLRAQVAAFPIPEGAAVIAVNEAARLFPATWQLCNDGFTDPKFGPTLGLPGRITRKRFASTIPTGDVFYLDAIGIVEGDFSTTCAIRCAASARPATLMVYGHDLVPGTGADGLTGAWPDSQISSCRAEVQKAMESAARQGVTVQHVRGEVPAVHRVRAPRK